MALFCNLIISTFQLICHHRPPSSVLSHPIPTTYTYILLNHFIHVLH